MSERITGPARVALLLGASMIVPSFAATANAGPAISNGIHGVRFDVHADLGGYASLGAGFRADIPLVPNGFVQGVDDELALSLGVDVFFQDFYYDYYHGGPYMVPLAVAQWNFYVAPKWSVFPEAGLALYVGDADDLPRGNAVYATVALGVGARYHFSHRNALLMRISNPTGLQLGVTF